MAWQWALSTLGSSLVVTALLAVAGYLGRSQLAHWLHKDIEKIKAEHNRQLEAYKVSLIAEAERAKAAQDVRKAIAVRMAEKRFTAIDSLHSTYVQQTRLMVMLAMWDEAGQKADVDVAMQLAELNNNFSRACKMSQPFLSPQDHNAVSDLAFHCSALLLEALGTDASGLKKLMDRVRPEIVRRMKECDGIIEAELRGLLDMTR